MQNDFEEYSARLVIICEESEEIIATFSGKGKTHDAKIYEKSNVKLSKETEIKDDSGYQGLQKKYGKVLIPKKNSKLKKLTKENESGDSGQANKSRKCDSPIKDISDISRAVLKSKKKTGIKIQLNFKNSQLRTQG